MSRAGEARFTARIFPSGPALEKALEAEARRSPGGLLFTPPWYTLQNLLPELLAQAPLEPGWEPLAPMAGPLLVQEIIQENQLKTELYAGLALGRKLPRRLWRLLVEVKAAGLGPTELTARSAQPGSRMLALARLLGRYNEALADLKLSDEADQLAVFEGMLNSGQKPHLMENWQGLEAAGLIWLRTLDQRLITALAQVVPVKLGFCFTPEQGAPPALFGLMEATERALMARAPDSLELVWDDVSQSAAPLSGLVRAWLGREGALDANAGIPLEMVMEPGRYSQAEGLVRRALDLVEGGADPRGIALVFPDLELHGQMVSDAARRLGLPLAYSRKESLASAPLVQALFELLELPLMGYPRRELARVWENDYLNGYLHQAAGGINRLPRGDFSALLARAGYVDGRESGASDYLRRLGRRTQNHGLDSLAQSLDNIKAKLKLYSEPNNIFEYIKLISALTKHLEPSPHTAAAPPKYPGAAPGPAQIQSRDLAAWQGLGGALQDLDRAAGQIKIDQGRPKSPGRLLALLKETLGSVRIKESAGPVGGVRLLRLDQTLGLDVEHVLAGGLNQGEFPQRPQGQNLLSKENRLSLGRLARMPVWRTDEEEYSGQVLSLMRLMAAATGSAALFCSAADQTGKQAEPSGVFIDISRIWGQDPRKPGGGVYGALPPLGRCREPGDLWSRISAELLGRGEGEAELARACLQHLRPDTSNREFWDNISSRAQIETQRRWWDYLEPQGRAQESGPHGGRLLSPEALGLLQTVMDSKRSFSPSSLETYASCPMAWFYRYLLGLAPEDEPGWDLERWGEGQWVHAALCRFFNPEEYQSDWDEEQIAARLEMCLDQAQAELEQGAPAGHRVVRQARRDVLAVALKLVVKRECAELAQLSPKEVETQLAPLQVPVGSGRNLEISGRLDRLDAGKDIVQVTDYKHSSDYRVLNDPVNRGLVGESAFQIPVYLAAALAWSGGSPACKGRVVSTASPQERVRYIPFKANDPFFETDPERRKSLKDDGEPNLFNSVISLWERLTGGDFTPHPAEPGCGYCQFQGVCRAQADIILETA